MQSEAPGVAPEVPEWFISPGHATQGGPAQLQGTEFKFCAAQGAPGPPALPGQCQALVTTAARLMVCVVGYLRQL